MRRLGPDGVDGIDICLADLDATEPVPSMLSTAELDRGDQFKSPVHRHRFLAGRTLLRQLLSEVTGRDPAALTFTTNDHGKPFLVDDAGRLANGPAFNMSRSNELVLFAVAQSGSGFEAGSVGVDIEHVRPIEVEALARRFFSLRERSDLEAVEADRRLGAFFNVWARKEAVIKADGRGLSVPLDSFSVSVGREAQVTDPGPSATFAYRLRPIDVGDDARAAVAIQGFEDGRAPAARRV